MPHFYFDTHDGESTTRDNYGIELGDPREALFVAVDTLPELVQGISIPHSGRPIGVCVRGDGGAVVVEVSLDVVVKWGKELRTRACAHPGDAGA